MRNRIWVILCIALSITILSSNKNVNALSSTIVYPECKLWMTNGDDVYNLENSSPVIRIVNEKNTIGKLAISGFISRKGNKGSLQAYESQGILSLSYEYDGDFKTGEDNNWNLIKDSEKNVCGIDVSSKIAKGAVVIQKSYDNVLWENACEPIVNFFEDYSTNSKKICEVTDSDVKIGTYYRVYVVYGLEQKRYDIECRYIELYEFYVGYDGIPIVVSDVSSRNALVNHQTVKYGFTVDILDSERKIYIRKDDETKHLVSDKDFFCKAGKYKIECESFTGVPSVFSVEISEGIHNENVDPIVYISNDNEGYPEKNRVYLDTVFGSSSLTSLSICQGAEYSCVRNVKNSRTAYGINGDEVFFVFKIKDISLLNNNGWELAFDEWGAKSSELVAGTTNSLIHGISTGPVGTGTLIIQTSKDGKNWTNSLKDRYAEGLYTSSFETFYGRGRNIVIYKPSGEDIINGEYIRVLYAYEMTNGEEVKNFLEVYEFYLCSSNLDSVTFHNLTLLKDENANSIDFGDADSATIELYKKAETMLNGSYTVTGFQIDTELNPIVSVNVKKDGKTIEKTFENKYTTSGKYEITLTSAVGNTKIITIYVDRSTDEEFIKKYFGESFVEGVREYNDNEGILESQIVPEYYTARGAYPVCRLKSIIDGNIKLYGLIKNMSKGTETPIEQLSSVVEKTLSEPGQYKVIFSTNPYKFSSDEAVLSGDERNVTFSFNIVTSEPLPKVNKSNLENKHNTIFYNINPIVYGIQYQSTGGGRITLLFTNKKDAIEYAYEKESEQVEPTEWDEDGNPITFKYGGSIRLDEDKITFSAENLDNAKQIFAEQSVQNLYIDMSDPYTYITFKDSKILYDENGKVRDLRSFKLNNSVRVFEKNQDFTIINQMYPIINDLPSAYINVEENKDGYIQSGNLETDQNREYAFIKDNLGLDSASISIKDSNGNIYNDIRYGESVAEQLKEKKCSTGIIEIIEKTIYNYETKYKAVYIAENDNTTEVKIKYSVGGVDYTKDISQGDVTNIEADKVEVISVKDEFDKNGIIKINKVIEQKEIETMDDIPHGNDLTHVYSVCESENGFLDSFLMTEGLYTIECVNRLGYSYLFQIKINETNALVISFEGIGTSDLEDITTAYGEKNIKLPEPSKRYGYRFIGFYDITNNLDDPYDKGYIPEINNKGVLRLKAMWENKDVKVYLYDEDDNLLGQETVKYDDIYTLPTIDLADDTSYIEWKYNEDIITTNEITIDTEEDIKLVACVSKGESEHLTPTQQDNSTHNNGMVYTIIIIVCAVIGIFSVLYFVTYRKKANSNEDK